MARRVEQSSIIFLYVFRGEIEVFCLISVLRLTSSHGLATSEPLPPIRVINLKSLYVIVGGRGQVSIVPKDGCAVSRLRISALISARVFYVRVEVFQPFV
jgi:hypothetical protein